MIKKSDNFDLYSVYYDLIYAGKKYPKETDYVLNLLHKYVSPLQSILELGSGTGNYSQLLCEKGLSVTGIEKSPQMIEISNLKNIKGFNPILGDITKFDLSTKFDAVVSLFHVISYLTRTEDVIQCFKNASNHLSKNGLFLFDVWFSPSVYSLKAEKRIKEVENDQYKIIRQAIPSEYIEQNTITVLYEIGITDKSDQHQHKLEEVHTMRHFSTPEIKLFADIAGMKLVQSEEFLTANKPSKDTWGVCYLLQKI